MLCYLKIVGSRLIAFSVASKPTVAFGESNELFSKECRPYAGPKLINPSRPCMEKRGAID